MFNNCSNNHSCCNNCNSNFCNGNNCYPVCSKKCIRKGSPLDSLFCVENFLCNTQKACSLFKLCCLFSNFNHF